VDLPEHEIDTFVLTTKEAVDLADRGEIGRGFRCLSAGMKRGQKAEADGEEWGRQLVKLYQEALDRYAWEYGARLLRWSDWPLSGWLTLSGSILIGGSMGMGCLGLVPTDLSAVFTVLGVVVMFFAFMVFFAERLRSESRPPNSPTSSPVFPPETSLLELDGFMPDGFVHGIEILNDNETPIEFVVMVLEKHASLGGNAAIWAALEIHHSGGLLLPLASEEEAQRAAEAIAARAAAENYPLVCRAVSVRSVSVDADAREL
jgi:ATP-dependent Clp protease adaptor protein ClpS